MRKFVIVIVVLALVVAGAVAYLQSTTPKTAAGVRFPLTPEQRALLSSVPTDAEAFALVPTAAALHAKLIANPITRDPVTRWGDENPLPRPWMLGGTDLVVWKSDKSIRYAARLDPFRAALVRAYLFFNPERAASFLVNPPTRDRVPPEIEQASGLPAGDVFVVQRHEARGTYPPIGRPAISSVQIGAREVTFTSRAPLSEAPKPQRATVRYPVGALLSASFAEAPRVAGDLNRLFGSKLSDALQHGGSIVIYDIDTGTLLPSPKGVIVLPLSTEARDRAQRLSGVAQVRETTDAVLVSFDRTSLDAYTRDRFVEFPWPSSDWSLRIDAKRMIPILEKLGDNVGLRFATPRLYRSARDLRGWIGALSGADTIEAAHNQTNAGEELAVRISSK